MVHGGVRKFMSLKKPLGLKKYKIVMIEWKDSKGMGNSWEFIDDIEPLKPETCFSVGFLLEDNKEYKTILQSYGGSQILGRTTIPSCAIASIKQIK